MKKYIKIKILKKKNIIQKITYKIILKIKKIFQIREIMKRTLEKIRIKKYLK